MGMWIGRNRKARVTYGFDEIALVPGEITINPLEVDTTFEIPRKDQEPIKLKIPILASAMDKGVQLHLPTDAVVAMVAHKDQMPTSPLSGVHFFPFGGLKKTADWANKVIAGDFELNNDGGLNVP